MGIELFQSEITETPLFAAADMDSTGNASLAKKLIFRTGVFYCILAAVISVYMVAKGQTPVVCILLCAFAFFTVAADSKKERTKNQTYNAFYFYDDRYVNIDRLSQYSVPYELVIMVIETKDSFLISSEYTRVHIVEKTAISQGSAEELSGFLRSKVKKYIKR